jgi:SAM-dependent methyltransferase
MTRAMNVPRATPLGRDASDAACNPFLDPRRVRGDLYADSERLTNRTSALMRAKTSGRRVPEVIVDLARAHAARDPSGEPMRILDVGCGRGSSSLTLRASYPTANLTLLDLSFDLLAAASQRLRSTGEPAAAIQADFHHLPVADRSFDLIVAAFCLYHSRSPEAVIAEFARCLRETDDSATILVTKSQDSYHELDILVAAAGLDAKAARRGSLYESAHSENLVSLVAATLGVREVVHERHTFRFDDLAHVAQYVATVPKYQLPAQLRGRPDRIAEALRRGQPDGPVTTSSVVTYVVAQHDTVVTGGGGSTVNSSRVGRRSPDIAQGTAALTYEKTYPDRASVARAVGNHTWLASLVPPLRLPKLHDVADLTIRFEGLDGMHVTLDHLLPAATHLGEVHAAAHQTYLHNADLREDFTAELPNGRRHRITGFLAPRLDAVAQALNSGVVPDPYLDLGEAHRLMNAGARGPAAFYKDCNPRNLLIPAPASCLGPATIDVDDLTLAPFGYDVAKLVVGLAMTVGRLPDDLIVQTLSAYNLAVGSRIPDVRPVTMSDFIDWAEISHILNSRYLGRHGYVHSWHQLRPQRLLSPVQCRAAADHSERGVR